MDAHGQNRQPFPDGPELLTVDRVKARDEFYRTYPADNQKAKNEAFRCCEKDAIEKASLRRETLAPTSRQPYFGSWSMSHDRHWTHT
jgi:hypothetical protein